MAPVGHAVSTSAGLSLARSACSAGDWEVVFFGGMNKNTGFFNGLCVLFFGAGEGVPRKIKSWNLGSMFFWLGGTTKWQQPMTTGVLVVAAT